jgi:hypothetical protein
VSEDSHGKTPVQRVLDGDPLYQGDVRAAVTDLHRRLETLEAGAGKAVPAKKAAKATSAGKG